MAQRWPKRGEVLTAVQVESDLALRDMPFYNIPIKRDPEVEYAWAPVQTAHLTVDELLAVPGFADSKWRFDRETDEWIPLFDFVGTAEEALAFVDVHKVWNTTFGRYEWWVLPKGHPRDYQG